MLEAAISLRRDAATSTIGGKDNPTKLSRDFLEVRKSPGGWSITERKRFLIHFHKDDPLEASMTGDRLPIPYAVYDDIDDGVGGTVRTLINRSSYRVPLEMFTGSPGLDPDDATSEPVEPNDKAFTELSDLNFDDSSRL